MSLFTYVIKRALVALGLILLVATINFTIVHLAPGGPATVLLTNPRITAAERAQLLASYGLDKPLYTQYILYITGMFTGNWGISYSYLEPSSSVIEQRIFPTLLLMVPSLILTIIVGLLLGIIGARKPFSLLDRFTSSFTFFFYAMPTFWLGFVLLTIFALDFRLLPAGGMTSILGAGSITDQLTHLILPMTTLTLVNLANFTLLIRTSLIDVLDQNYILTARGKGLTERAILFRHALRNALLPTVTMTGLFIGFLLSGAILTESVFSWPGLGLLTFQSVLSRDYPVILSLFFIFSVMIIASNLVTDIIYGFLDPRVTYE